MGDNSYNNYQVLHEKVAEITIRKIWEIWLAQNAIVNIDPSFPYI
jgi:hypothetical protein